MTKRQQKFWRRRANKGGIYNGGRERRTKKNVPSLFLYLPFFLFSFLSLVQLHFPFHHNVVFSLLSSRCIPISLLAQHPTIALQSVTHIHYIQNHRWSVILNMSLSYDIVKYFNLRTAAVLYLRDPLLTTNLFFA